MKKEIVGILIVLLLLAQVTVKNEVRHAKRDVVFPISTQAYTQVGKEEEPLTEKISKSRDTEIFKPINILKTIIVIGSCIFTTAVSLMGESLIKRIIFQIKNIVFQLTANQQLSDNISSKEAEEIRYVMNKVRRNLKAIRLSLFEVNSERNLVFQEVVSEGKHSLFNSPSVSRYFFENAIQPMIETRTIFSYCSNHNDSCYTWLSGRGTGRYAIYLFFRREEFGGFILVEWGQSFFENLLIHDKNIDYCESQLRPLAAIISRAINDKN